MTVDLFKGCEFTARELDCLKRAVFGYLTQEQSVSYRALYVNIIEAINDEITRLVNEGKVLTWKD